MCDLQANERRERYKALREAGHTPAWSRRARDFSNPHFEFHKNHRGTVYD